MLSVSDGISMSQNGCESREQVTKLIQSTFQFSNAFHIFPLLSKSMFGQHTATISNIHTGTLNASFKNGPCMSDYECQAVSTSTH